MDKVETQNHFSSKKQSKLSLQSIFSILGVLGSLLIFIFVIALAYLPNRSESVDSERVKERRLNLKQNRADQESRVNSYGWVNKEAGTVRIPIDRAIELVVEKLAKEQSEMVEEEVSEPASEAPVNSE